VYPIRYEFFVEGKPQRSFDLKLDPRTFTLPAPAPDAALPAWTKLEHAKCPNCPLREDQSPHCPAAAHLAELVAAFAHVQSIDATEVRVTLPERAILKKTSAQEGLSALVGLVMVTSGCPILARLRPMARFHLPFANEKETVFRATGTYLIAQFLRQARGEKPDWSLEGLAAIYREVGAVNRAFAVRLRAAVKLDANINALVLLDVFTKIMPATIEEQLNEFQALFEELKT
jgi:hypothetical protein